MSSEAKRQAMQPNSAKFRINKTKKNFNSFVEVTEVKGITFDKPEVWAKGLVETLGAEDAAKLASREARPMIGSHNDVKNPNAAYFISAYNWIVKRYPKTKVKQTEQAVQIKAEVKSDAI